MRRAQKKPEPIAAAMRSIIERLDSEGHFGLMRLVRVWPEVVGEQIARRTEIKTLKFHTATVKVSSAMWLTELNFMRPQILARLKEHLGEEVVRELRFVKGTLGRRERPRLRAVTRAPRHAIKLPEFKDPELRRAFERLIEAWGRSPR